ncbi:MAG: hypothetical protein QXL16_01735 [Candidatus Micrarchaeaceae archaeon]
MMILSAEKASVSQKDIKKFVLSEFGVRLTNDAASLLASIMNKRLRKISKKAVSIAKKKGGEVKVTKDDVELALLDGEFGGD